MKFAHRLAAIILSGMCVLLVSCGQSAEAQWQEQYDLGVRYLSEGNYEEAVIAFTAAIEIDPKRTEAYSGLADAYLAMGDYESAAAVWADAGITDPELLAMFTTQSERYAAIQAELESGEPGGWITSLSFDQESFLAGDETEFYMMVLYRTPESGDFRMQVSANVEEPEMWQWQGEDTEIPGGIGVRQVVVRLTPARWEGPYFGLQVGIWQVSGDQNWDWIDGDTWYITPDGEVSYHYAPLNAYGATEFVYRNGHMAFEDFTPAEQQFISTVAAAAIAGDTETIRSQLGFEFENYARYTTWNGYKIEIHNSSGNLDESGDETVYIELELRPENGTGYYVNVYHSEKVDLSLEPEDHWMDYYNVDQVITCPCVDWQWNGAVTSNERTEYLWRHTDGATNHSINTVQITGTMADGLWDNASTETTHEISDWSPWDDSDETTTTTRVFQDGVLVEENGEPWDGGQGYHLITMGKGGGIIYHDEQSFLDARYW